jgi:hypothetical protein
MFAAPERRGNHLHFRDSTQEGQPRDFEVLFAPQSCCGSVVRTLALQHRRI